MKVGLLSLRVVPQQQCNGHDIDIDIVFVTLPSTAVETAIAQCTSGCAIARGHRRNTSIVLVAVHGLSGLFRRYPRSSLHSFVPPPPLISYLTSVDVTQHGVGPRSNRCPSSSAQALNVGSRGECSQNRNGVLNVIMCSPPQQAVCGFCGH